MATVLPDGCVVFVSILCLHALVVWSFVSLFLEFDRRCLDRSVDLVQALSNERRRLLLGVPVIGLVRMEWVLVKYR